MTASGRLACSAAHLKDQGWLFFREWWWHLGGCHGLLLASRIMDDCLGVVLGIWQDFARAVFWHCCGKLECYMYIYTYLYCACSGGWRETATYPWAVRTWRQWQRWVCVYFPLGLIKYIVIVIVYCDLFKTDLRRVLSMTLQDFVPVYLSPVRYWVVHGRGRYAYIFGVGVGLRIMYIVISMCDLCWVG